MRTLPAPRILPGACSCAKTTITTPDKAYTDTADTQGRDEGNAYTVGECEMTEWILTNPELKKVANCELDTVHPHLACDRTPDGLIDCQHCPVGYYCGFIARAGQRKLLEYLIKTSVELPMLTYADTKTPAVRKLFLESMLKQLEGQNG